MVIPRFSTIVSFVYIHFHSIQFYTGTELNLPRLGVFNEKKTQNAEKNIKYINFFENDNKSLKDRKKLRELRKYSFPTSIPAWPYTNLIIAISVEFPLSAFAAFFSFL